MGHDLILKNVPNLLPISFKKYLALFGVLLTLIISAWDLDTDSSEIQI
jgi:hypothetical protein